MITIPLSTEDLTRVRFALSPLWETTSSFRVLMAPEEYAAHLPWIRNAREALRGTDLTPVTSIMRPRGYRPDFLSPPPGPSTPGFEAELENLLDTPPDVVCEEVETFCRDTRGDPGVDLSEKKRTAEDYRRDPRGSLERLAETLHAYHEAAIAPHWPRMRVLLEGDVLKRAEALALGGVGTLFANLNPYVRYREDALMLDKPYEWVIEPDGRGMILVPCVFAAPGGIGILTSGRWQPTLAYAPRGTAKLWASSPTSSAGSSLGAALSPGRASVLKGLLVPCTTTELAARVGVGPSTISGHLSRLRTAGLVEPHRSGRKVYYRLTFLGDSLLALFGEDD